MPNHSQPFQAGRLRFQPQPEQAVCLDTLGTALPHEILGRRP